MFLAPKVGWLWDLSDVMLHHMAFDFHNSPQLIPRMEGDLGCKDKRRTEGSGERGRGMNGSLVEDQTHCDAKKTKKK